MSSLGAHLLVSKEALRRVQETPPPPASRSRWSSWRGLPARPHPRSPKLTSQPRLAGEKQRES